MSAPIALTPEHVQWVERFARKAHRMMQRRGCATLQLEDVEQECWVAWCKARDGYDPEGRAAFTTYLYRGMELHLRRWRENLVTASRASVLGDDAVTAAESALHLEDPAESVEFRHARERVLRRMSRITRLVVTLLSEPPDWLQAEERAARAKVQWSRQRGFNVTEVPTMTLVCRALGLERTQRLEVLREMKRFARTNDLSQC